MNKSELTRFAALYGLRRELDSLVDSRGGTLYGELRDDMRELWEETGCKSRSILMGDDNVDVGTVSVITTQAKSKDVLYCTDTKAFAAWLAGDGLAYFSEFIHSKDGRKLLEVCCSSLVVDGVLPDGCEHEVESQPTQFSHIKITGCDLGKIAAAARKTLPAVVEDALMLPEGE